MSPQVRVRLPPADSGIRAYVTFDGPYTDAAGGKACIDCPERGAIIEMARMDKCALPGIRTAGTAENER